MKVDRNMGSIKDTQYLFCNMIITSKPCCQWNCIQIKFDQNLIICLWIFCIINQTLVINLNALIHALRFLWKMILNIVIRLSFWIDRHLSFWVNMLESYCILCQIWIHSITHYMFFFRGSLQTFIRFRYYKEWCRPILQF